MNDEQNSNLFQTKCESLLESIPGLLQKLNAGQLEFGGSYSVMGFGFLSILCTWILFH